MRACPRCLTVYESDPEYCAFDGTQTVALTEDTDPLAGADLDAYRLEGRLGVGGTGCVYRARRPADGSLCAIKLLFGEMATDRGLAERFRREARAMQHIQHKNVAAVYDCQTSDAGLTYLVMEFVEGGTLKEIVEEEAPLAPGRVARLADQLVAGMAEAHRLGYVHRDLKPSNVMVGGPPGSEIAKILDFGIVASLHEQEQDHRLTKTGYIVGTPTYMAPEQVDPKSVTPQADVYALGVMIYEMLAGKPPFTGTLEQILVAKMTAAPPPLEGAGELGALVVRLLATDPEDRPATALHVSAELARMSLLSADPATEKARVPELPDLGVVGFGRATVHLVDRTDENEVPDAPSSTGADTTPSPIPELRETAEGPWAVDTRLVPDPALVLAVDPAKDPELDRDTPEDAFPDFGDEAPTRAAPRADTLVDPQREALVSVAGFGETSSPTNPDRAPGPNPDDTVDDEMPEELPTRVECIGLAPRPASAASGPEHPTDEAPPAEFEEASDPAGDDATTMMPSLTDYEADEEEDEDSGEIGFADTRIRPSHEAEGSVPHWDGGSSPWAGGAMPPSLVSPASDVAATTIDPAVVGASSDLVDYVGPFTPPEDLEDGATSLSSLLPDGDPDNDPGDGDTALDFSLDDISPSDTTSETDLGIDEDEVRSAAGFVDPPNRRPGPAPADPPPRSRRWLVGALFAALLLVAAALTYRVLIPGDVIEIAPAPEMPSTP